MWRPPAQLVHFKNNNGPIHCPGYATSYISPVRITTVYLYFTYNNSIRDSIKERKGGRDPSRRRERERERERERL